MQDWGRSPRQVILLSPTTQALVLVVQKIYYLDASHTSHTVQEMAGLSIDSEIQAVILGNNGRRTVQSRTFTILQGWNHHPFFFFFQGEVVDDYGCMIGMDFMSGEGVTALPLAVWTVCMITCFG